MEMIGKLPNQRLRGSFPLVSNKVLHVTIQDDQDRDIRGSCEALCWKLMEMIGNDRQLPNQDRPGKTSKGVLHKLLIEGHDHDRSCHPRRRQAPLSPMDTASAAPTEGVISISFQQSASRHDPRRSRS